jgi:membrane fusion protein, epimerase transport system
MLQLERTATEFEGKIAAVNASSATASQAVEEYNRQIIQLKTARTAEVTGELNEVQVKLLELAPRLQNVRAALQRMEIRSPYAGELVGLAVFSVGAVIRPGDRILDVVPDRRQLIVEARIGVGDISDVHPGMSAEVDFMSYKQRDVPPLQGTVRHVSADRLTEERTGQAHYLAAIAVSPNELAAWPQIRLQPGMSATVLIPTQERTALEYLVGPLLATLNRSFRQR